MMPPSLLMLPRTVLANTRLSKAILLSSTSIRCMAVRLIVMEDLGVA